MTNICLRTYILLIIFLSALSCTYQHIDQEELIIQGETVTLSLLGAPLDQYIYEEYQFLINREIIIQGPATEYIGFTNEGTHLLSPIQLDEDLWVIGVVGHHGASTPSPVTLFTLDPQGPELFYQGTLSDEIHTLTLDGQPGIVFPTYFLQEYGRPDAQERKRRREQGYIAGQKWQGFLYQEGELVFSEPFLTSFLIATYPHEYRH
jgi:hypothetical protein